MFNIEEISLSINEFQESDVIDKRKNKLRVFYRIYNENIALKITTEFLLPWTRNI